MYLSEFIWKSVFSGDQFGYLNAALMNLGIINAPIAWLTNPQYLLTITIFVALWSSFGIGFLSILASLCNLDQELFEAVILMELRIVSKKPFMSPSPNERGNVL